MNRKSLRALQIAELRLDQKLLLESRKLEQELVEDCKRRLCTSIEDCQTISLMSFKEAKYRILNSIYQN